jgi:hypothetical protein
VAVIDTWESDPRIQSALADFKRGILDRYPDATFTIEVGGEPDGVYLMATVDLEDTLEVLDAIMDRVLEVQVDEELPVYVIPIRPRGSKYVAHSSLAKA